MKDQMTESDFEKWYLFSRSNNHPQLTVLLYNVLESKQSQKPFTIEQLSGDNGFELNIWEDYNPVPLKLQENDYDSFLRYLASFEYKVETDVENGLDSSEICINQDADSEEIPNNKKRNNNLLYKVLRIISSENKRKHIFTYSFIAFILLQPFILPGNLGHEKVDAPFAFYLLIYFVCYISLFAYSNFYKDIRTYWEIFWFTFRFGVYLFTLIPLELSIIDIIRGDDNLLLSFFILFTMGQAALFLVCFFITMLFYYIRGGKLIVKKNADA